MKNGEAIYMNEKSKKKTKNPRQIENIPILYPALVESNSRAVSFSLTVVRTSFQIELRFDGVDASRALDAITKQSASNDSVLDIL